MIRWIICRIIHALLGSQLVDDETLLTLMAEVEKILNDRPLTPGQVIRTILNLSPSRLLLLRPNVCFPPGESEAVHIYGKKRWKQAQYLADIFWKRWTREYLPTLQVTQKWLRPRPNLSLGDLVLVVRQVTVRTATSVLRRDVRKLCLLEGASELKAERKS